jgi:uncharacterized protein (TIGR03000 family)
MRTPTTGTHRVYVSNELKHGDTYTYVVRAEIPRGGRLLEETKTLSLWPGANVNVAFDFSGKDTSRYARAK